MNTERQDYILDHTGAENMEMIRQQFGGMSRATIGAFLDGIFEDDDNRELTIKIFDELNNN